MEKIQEKLDSKPEDTSLEGQYPMHDRRNENWKLEGFVKPDRPISLKKIAYYPTGNIPVYRYDWALAESKKKYNGAKLRELRKLNGVGKKAKVSV